MISRRYRIVLLSFWPGLAQVWAGQIAFGLLISVIFGLSLNFCIMSQWVYTNWFDPWVRHMVWGICSLTFAGVLGWTLLWVSKFHPERFLLEIDKLYRNSADNYLKGRWSDARDDLERVISLNPTDTEAMLRLSRLLERTGQVELAKRVLHECLETPGAKIWHWEINQLRLSLEKKRPETKSENS